MKKFLIILFLSSPIFADVPDEKLHQKCLYPSITIICKELGSLGSGIIIRSEKKDKRYLNVALTCAHCVSEPKAKYEINTYTYENWSEIVSIVNHDAQIFATSMKIDTAVVFFVSDREMPCADLGLDEKFYIGTKAHFFGCGLGDYPRLSEGRVTGVNTSPGFFSPRCTRHSAYTISGDSGSGFFNSENKLIGLICGTKTNMLTGEKFHSIAYSTQISAVKQWNEEEKGKLKFVVSKEKLPDEPFKLLSR